MDAAEDNRNAALAKLRGNFVRARRSAGDRGDADEIGLDAVRMNLFDAFVDDMNLCGNLGRNQRSQRRQRERRVSHRLLPDAAAMSIQRTARTEKNDAKRLGRHGSLTLSVRAPDETRCVGDWRYVQV